MMNEILFVGFLVVVGEIGVFFFLRWLFGKGLTTRFWLRLCPGILGLCLALYILGTYGAFNYAALVPAFIAGCSIMLTNFIIVTTNLVNPMKRIIGELRNGAVQVAAAAKNVSDSSLRASEGSSTQAASLEETSSSLEEMTAQSRETSDLTAGAEQLMNENIEKSINSLTSLVDLTRKMNKIEADSDKISQIIKTIDEIAFQTNLLALNAAVEAARAGEAGAGFAVVADEVRNLAIRATDAAKNTQELLDSTVKRIIESARAIKTMNNDFEGIIESATIIGEKTTAITEASKMQSRGIDQINLAVSDIDKVTQQNASNAEVFAGLSEDMSAQSRHLKRITDELVEIVGQESKKDSRPSMDPGKKEFEEKAGDEAAPAGKRETNPKRMLPLSDNDFNDF